MKNIIIITTRGITLWMIAVIGFLVYITRKYSISFPIGPNPELYLLQIPINTPAKYIGVITICFSNSVFRSLKNNILQSWITNHLQDESSILRQDDEYRFSYEISCVNIIYAWFDWFLYMHILLSQIDLFLVEVSADIIMTVLITNYYLGKKSSNIIPLRNDFQELTERSRLIRKSESRYQTPNPKT